MITQTEVDGKQATVVYLKRDFTPCAESEAECVKVMYEDGTTQFIPLRKETTE